MITADQIARFAAQAARARQAAFGQTPVRYRDTDLCVVSTTVTRREQLEDGGFALEADAIIRLPTCLPLLKGNPPSIGETITYTANGDRLRINEVKPPGINPEWRIALVHA